MNNQLTDFQQAHVAKVFPECRAEMAQYLAQAAVVVVGPQNEDEEAPPFAITVAGTNFWIDCCATEEAAKATAIALGLRIRENDRAGRLVAK